MTPTEQKIEVKTAAQLVQDHPELLVGSHAQIIERLDFLLLDARIAGLREAAEIACPSDWKWIGQNEQLSGRRDARDNILSRAAQLEKERKVCSTQK